VKDLLDLLVDTEGIDKRREIAEYINTHPEELEEFLSTVFDENGSKWDEMKRKLLELTDFIKDKLSLSIIEHGISDCDSLIRVRALQAAYRMRIDSLNERVAQILDSQEEIFEARKWALHILASTDSLAFSRKLRKIARNSLENPEIRKEAVFSLTRIDDDKIIGTLCALLGDSNVELRRSGAWALAQIGSSDSINCLLAALDDDDAEVRDWAIRGLRDVDDSRALQGLANALESVTPDEQVRMIRLIIDRRSEIVLRVIAQLLTSHDVNVRRQAAWAMGVAPYPPAAGNLEILLEDSDERVQDYAKVALARIGKVDPTGFEFSL
jgi:HEAT repeat protein